MTRERSSWDTLFNFYHHDPDRFYKMYAEGRIDQDEWALSNLREMMRNCSVIPTAEAERALIENTHLRSGLEECVSDLTSLGIRCAILSTGTEPLARWIGEKAGFRTWKANWFETDANGGLVPNYIRRVSFLEKEKWLSIWKMKYRLADEEIVAIGDSCNDAGMFLSAGHSIAFDPSDECAAMTAEVIVEGDDLRRCSDLIANWHKG